MRAFIVADGPFADPWVHCEGPVNFLGRQRGGGMEDGVSKGLRVGERSGTQNSLDPARYVEAEREPASSLGLRGGAELGEQAGLGSLRFRYTK